MWQIITALAGLLAAIGGGLWAFLKGRAQGVQTATTKARARHESRRADRLLEASHKRETADKARREADALPDKGHQRVADAKPGTAAAKLGKRWRRQ